MLQRPVPDFILDEQITRDIYSVDELINLYPSMPEKLINARHARRKSFPLRTAEGFQIYTWHNLSDLIHELQQKNPYEIQNDVASDEEVHSHLNLLDEPLYGIRYLLTRDKVFLFAKEGNHPAHFMMTGEDNPQFASCLCAGNIYFNKNYTKIIKINNKSGDFEPEPERLKNVIIALATLHQKKMLQLGEKIVIEHLNVCSLEQQHVIINANRSATGKTVWLRPSMKQLAQQDEDYRTAFSSNGEHRNVEDTVEQPKKRKLGRIRFFEEEETPSSSPTKESDCIKTLSFD